MTDSPILLVPCGNVRDALRNVEAYLTDSLAVRPAIWLSETLPSVDQIRKEKRFIVIVAGTELDQLETPTRKRVGIAAFNKLCRLLTDTSPTTGVVILQADAPKNCVAFRVLRMDATCDWKQQLTEEFAKTRVILNPSDLRDRVASLITMLKLNLLEREEAVRLCVLSVLARESIFLLGPPGVAKSLIARRIKGLFPPEAKSFEYLMNRFSTPDEIFGPVSIAGLKNDRLERKTESYLPGADVVFLDEIWKAGPSIQNALLTAINERIFRNDGVDQPIPMRALISASNELPAEDEGLEALWDRFLVRLEVGNIEIPEHRHELIRGSAQMEVTIGDGERFVKTELAALDHQIDNVFIPDGVLAIIDNLLPQIEKFNHEVSESQKQNSDEPDQPSEFRKMYVSDRRWKKIARLLRTSALCNGRLVVNELDCYLISYCIWNDKEHIQPARQMVIAAIESQLSFVGLRQQWQQLQHRAAKLPATQYALPTVYPGPPVHYKIDLSKNGKLLADPQYGEFRRLPKECYESLTEDFSPIELHGSRKPHANLLAKKRGPSPVQITFMKDDRSPPLKPFPPTDFQLTHSAKALKGSRVDLSSESARTYLIELNQFRANLQVRRGNPNDLPDARSHLFVDLSSEVLDRLSTARENANLQLDSLLREVTKFAKEKGLE
jgi:MoxR-like ATPase